MSQLPPDPYGNPPPYGQSPGQVPAEYGSAGTGDYGPPARTSGVAVASLVLGILGICPLALVGGLVATVLGIAGLRATKGQGVKGRGLAIAGLVLGIVGLVGWGLGGAGFGILWTRTAPDRAAARQFVQALAAGDVSKATAVCQPGVTPAMLQPSIDYLKPAGTLQDTTVTGVNLQASTSAGSTATITVLMTYPSGTKSAVVTLTPGPGGNRLVQRWNLN